MQRKKVLEFDVKIEGTNKILVIILQNVRYILQIFLSTFIIKLFLLINPNETRRLIRRF